MARQTNDFLPNSFPFLSFPLLPLALDLDGTMVFFRISLLRSRLAILVNIAGSQLISRLGGGTRPPE